MDEHFKLQNSKSLIFQHIIADTFGVSDEIKTLFIENGGILASYLDPMVWINFLKIRQHVVS